MQSSKIMLALGLMLAVVAAPMRGTARADLTCAQACKQSQKACAASCKGRPHAGLCRRACNSGRVRRACVNLCKQNGG